MFKISMFTELKNIIFPSNRRKKVPEFVEVNRITLSINKDVLETIDAVIENTAMFSGRSDFIFCAIRDLYLEYLEESSEWLIKYRDMYPNFPGKALAKYSDFSIFNCQRLIKDNEIMYEQKRKQQISIYVKPNMMDMLNNMIDMLSDPDDYGPIVLAAIYNYINKCVKKFNLICDFVDIYNELYDGAYGPDYD